MDRQRSFRYMVGLPQKAATILGILLNFVVLIVDMFIVMRVIQIESNLSSWTWAIGITSAVMVVLYLIIVIAETAGRSRKIKGIDYDLLYAHATRGLLIYLVLGIVFIVFATAEYGSTSSPEVFLGMIMVAYLLGSLYLISDTLFEFTAKGNEDRRIAGSELLASQQGV
jgi:hypothetical protein